VSKKRRKFSNELKFTIVLEAIKGQRQISEIATEYQVHPNQISNWKKQFLSNGSAVFSDKSDKREEELAQTQEDLFKKIGRQQYEIDWLKKNLNRLELWKNEK
jgi:transposase-like protein